MKNSIKKFKTYFWTHIYLRKFIRRGKNLKINGKCRFDASIVVGNNVNFNGMEIKGNGKVKIGDNFHSGRECLILTSFHNYEGSKIPYDETVISKEVIIKNNVWFGERVIILGGVTIEEGAIVQAGSVVVSNVGKCEIVGGSPAKVFKKRNVEHYENLKEARKFH